MRPEQRQPLRKGLRSTLKGVPTGRRPRVVQTTYGKGQQKRDWQNHMREWYAEWKAGKGCQET